MATETRNPFAIQQIAGRMTNLQPAVRDEFIAIAGRMAMDKSTAMTVEEAIAAGHARTSPEQESTVFEINSKQPATMKSNPAITPIKTEVIMRR